MVEPSLEAKIAFLKSTAAYSHHPRTVESIETHMGIAILLVACDQDQTPKGDTSDYGDLGKKLRIHRYDPAAGILVRIQRFHFSNDWSLVGFGSICKFICDGNNNEEEEERLEGRKRRRLSLSADRCENQEAE